MGGYKRYKQQLLHCGNISRVTWRELILQHLHSGYLFLDAEIIGILDYNVSIKKDNVMLRSIYRTISIARAATAANRLLQFSSPRMLDDMGIVKEIFIADTVAKVQAEFDAKDAAKANQSMSNLVNSRSNPNLAEAV